MQDHKELMMTEQPEHMKELAKKIIAKFDKLAAARSNWEIHWQDCMKYIIPRKGDVNTTRTQGDKRGDELFDSTAITANEMLAGALHGMLTNPAVKFFELVFEESDIEVTDEVKKWLDEVENKMFTVINNSNFQTEVHEIYIDEGAIGTACLYTDEHDERVVHFSARAMKEIFADENNLGLIDTVFRKFSWKPMQIIQEFGEDKVPPQVTKMHNSGCDDALEIIHAVFPACPIECKCCNSEKKKILPFRSIYVMKESSLILSDGGFKEFPFAVPRWTKTTGETYGRGPGMKTLADIKMVNEMMKTTIEGAQMTVRPPIVADDDSVIGKARMTPGGLIIKRPGSEVKPFNTDARIDFGYQVVEDARKRIRAGFYVDQLQLDNGPQMTATEVMQRTEEKLRLMGPVLGRQHFEFLRPVIDRVFAIMSRKGLIPPAPKEIQGKKFDVRYSSLVARAQRMSEGQNFQRAISTAAPIINADPKSLDNINADKALKHIFDIYGVPSKIMNTEREVADLREARQQAQAELIQQQQQSQQVDMASKMMPGIAQMQMAQEKGK